MTKPKSVAVNAGGSENQDNAEHVSGHGNPKPLSGSKTVKNRNHSRNNHGEGF